MDTGARPLAPVGPFIILSYLLPGIHLARWLEPGIGSLEGTRLEVFRIQSPLVEQLLAQQIPVSPVV